MALANYIRDIQGFQKGILFKDITPLLIDPKATKRCLEILVSSLKDKKIDKVIGWRVAAFLRDADRSGTERRFRAVRKPNKLTTSISASYELEYGTDTLKYTLMPSARAIGYLFMMMSSQLEEPRAVMQWWRWAVKSSS
jgi:adenine phosphoribosyltransferase